MKPTIDIFNPELKVSVYQRITGSDFARYSQMDLKARMCRWEKVGRDIPGYVNSSGQVLELSRMGYSK